jgi:hypothetical protein
MIKPKILSLCPGSRQIGYAYFEGEKLAEWGVKDNSSGPMPERLLTKGLRIIMDLVGRYEPELIILPSFENEIRRTSRRNFTNAAASILGMTKAQVVFRLPRQSMDFFANQMKLQKAKKHQVMVDLAMIFQELSLSVPRPRRPWDPQSYWTPMFDAVAQGYSWIKSNES